MIYKVYGKAHYKIWQDFKEKISGIIVEYDVVESVIKSITYRVKKPISEEILEEFEFTAERIL